MTKFLKGMFYENGTPSRTGIFAGLLTVVPILVWAFVSLYLCTTGKPFAYYETMCLSAFGTSGGGGILAGANKLINSLYNSGKDQFPVKDAGTPPAPTEGGNQ
jgi:hypothetical protein